MLKMANSHTSNVVCPNVPRSILMKGHSQQLTLFSCNVTERKYRSSSLSSFMNIILDLLFVVLCANYDFQLNFFRYTTLD